MGGKVESKLSQILHMASGLAGTKMENIGLMSFLVIMIISLLSSLFISFLYVTFYEGRSTGSQIHRSFALLGISITAIFICIQFSLPLSLGLLGALSIVRFRTPIKEPEEIGFIMLIVAVSISSATFNLVFLSILLIIAVIALIIMRYGRIIWKGRLNDGMLIVALPKNEYALIKKDLMALLEKNFPRGRIDSVSESKEESTISYSFANLNKEVLLNFQNELNTLSADASSNFFFNRSGQI